MRRLLFLLFVLLILGGIGGGVYYFWLRPDPVVEPTETAESTTQTTDDEKREAAPATGSLVIESEPSGVDIKLNGKKTNKQTPATFEDLALGPQLVELSSANVYKWWIEVEVTAEDAAMVRALLVERDTGLTVRDSRLPKLGFNWQSTIPEAGDSLTRASIAELTNSGIFVIRMQFNPGLDPRTIVGDAVSIYDATTETKLKTSIGYLPTSGELLIRVDPADQITESGTYQVVLAESIADVNGILLGVRVAWMFGEEALADLIFFDSASAEAIEGEAPTNAPQSDPASSPISPADEALSTTAIQRDTERKQELEDVAKALEAYLALQQNYPRQAQEGDLIAIRSSLVPNLISELPFDPLAGPDATLYRYQSAGDSFTLKATLEAPVDGEPATFTLYDAKRPSGGAVLQ